MITVVTWNVKHFKRHADAQAGAERIDRVVGLLAEQEPDVFALFEVTGAEVFSTLTRRMPDYSMTITEGPQTQEILVGSRNDRQTFTTQRLEFKSGARSLRPGALHTVIDGDTLYPMLFLHLKSFPTSDGFGIRTDQLEKAFGLRKVIDREAERMGFTTVRYLFAGDLNVMGMDLAFSDSDISEEGEIDRLRLAADRRDMVLAPKTEATTWHAPQSDQTSDLDHVVHGANVTLVPPAADEPPVEVIGWPQLAGHEAQRQWVSEVSDHALLRFQIDTN